MERERERERGEGVQTKYEPCRNGQIRLAYDAEDDFRGTQRESEREV